MKRAIVIAGLLATGLATPAFSEELTWGFATANVATCVTGVTCGVSPVTVLAKTSVTDADNDYINASVFQSDYSQLTSANYGQAWASAQAGEGLLGLPVLKAYALGGATGAPPGPFTIGVNYAAVLGVQGYTNTGSTGLLIPLNAFTGLVDYEVHGAPGTVGAALAITTSAILDPTIADQWFQADVTPGANGQFAATCATPGALALGGSTANQTAPATLTQFLPITTQSCTGSSTFLLGAGQTFYVWARLAAVHSASGVTDASHTFNVTITPEAQAGVETDLLPHLTLASGADLVIHTDSPVPEPSTWTMLILGFGAVGAGLRRRRVLAA